MDATMPIWGAVVLAIVVALVPQVGGYLLQRARLRAESAREEQRRNEERAAEWHRNVRWAAEQIIAGTEQGRLTGVEMLDVLDDADFVTDHELALIDAILLTVIDPVLPEAAESGYHEIHDERGGDPA